MKSFIRIRGIFAALIVMALLITCTGRQQDAGESSEPYTVAIQVVVLPGTNFEGKADREAAINAITVPAINVRVEIQETWINQVVNTTAMSVASNEKIDLIHVATVQRLSSLVGSDILLDMNENNILQTYGKDLIRMFGGLMDTGYVNGRQLAIPALNYTAASYGVYLNKDMADQYGIRVPEKTDMDGLEAMLLAFRRANTNVVPYSYGTAEMNFLQFVRGYDGFGREASYGAILDSTRELKVENIYASALFRDFVIRMFSWRQNGLIPGDTTDATPNQTYFAARQLFANPASLSPQANTAVSAQSDFNVAFVELTERKVTGNLLTEYMWGIATTSRNPRKVMEFLNLMYTNGDVANILMYGLNGVNYNFAPGSNRVVVRNGTYNPVFFRGGNPDNMYILSPAGYDYVDQLKAYEASATVSPVAAYMFNDSAFQTEAAVIYATILEYLPRLQSGAAASERDILALLDQFNTQLRASGIDRVIAENQRQLDAWLRSR